MKWGFTGSLLALLAATATGWPYDESLVDYNLNANKDTTNPAEYTHAEWKDHKYHPSPKTWRFPFYTLFIDRFVNGDPTNDNINGSLFEHDLNSNQMRHGGDAVGLVDTLDYLQGMGIKGIYLAGTVLMNQPWSSDGYSILDTTLLDQHFGTIQIWRDAITEIHKRGMYVLFDNTIATMGDLIGFEGYLNTTTPFSVKEHKALWKSNREYVDFRFHNDYNSTCEYPRFWNETGWPVDQDVKDQLVGCYNSDFDQYGDREAFGVYPDWQRQLAKFASVQDRLREWHPSVKERIIRHSCMIIKALDIDGFRYDKATQATVDALGDMSQAYRECARSVGKNNFFIPGEITGGNNFGSIYLGRGRQPNQYPDSSLASMNMTNSSDHQYFLREDGLQALDSAAFHYSVYRTLTRFLGMDGNLAAGYDTPLDWTDAWNIMVMTNDMINANTGKFDPRHMYGATNQDVFRWPAIELGIERQLMGHFITTLHLPGIPILLWGEEQAFYILDSTADNYIYGRQAMSPSTAWKTHGCYALGSSQYYNWPISTGREGCHDEAVTYDHRDPSHPVRNIIKHMFQMRQDFPVLNDGYSVVKLSKQTHEIQYPGSNGTATEIGIWSVLRDRVANVQDLGDNGDNEPVWLVYQNDNKTVEYKFDCGSNDSALISPFITGTTVVNLFYPHDEHELKDGPKSLHLNGTNTTNGCLDSLQLKPFEFRAYVPKANFVKPRPMITQFEPGHDVPQLSKVGPNDSEDIDVSIYFSTKMDCDKLTKSISFQSSTEAGKTPSISNSSVSCKDVKGDDPKWTGQIPNAWVWTAKLTGVYNGIHRLTVKNATSSDGHSSTQAVDHFLIRVGQSDNPMVFTSANYSTSLLNQHGNGTLYIQHRAAGANKYRYSTNWGSSFSDWKDYHGGSDTIEELPWSGTDKQKWQGKHVRVEYWNKLSGSSDYAQEGDFGYDRPRRFPHLFFNGPFNQYGYDAGLDNVVKLDSDGIWKFRLMAEFPVQGQFNVWGMNPDGRPDQSYVLGDIDNDGVLDRMPPSSLSSTVVNITDIPPSPYVAWNLGVDDGTLRVHLLPTGSRAIQIAVYFLLWFVPIVTAIACVYAFVKSFYQVKFNQVGVSEKKTILPLVLRRKLNPNGTGASINPFMRLANKSGFLQSTSAFGTAASRRRTTLIATMEYDIEDWAIKIKIGGLGVMAQLMGKHLGQQDLVWVVPCVGGVDYPVDQPAEPMFVIVLGNSYEVKVQYHRLKNITYVLLDAPVFRQQTKGEPYPARMDDLDSAIYYSAWNQCIAETIRRFSIDLYHINDYHGSIAPLYLLPQTVPVCLSLHNAEFQGLWPMRTQKERDEVCSVFNLDLDTARRYVQFGEVFNMLHAGASYLRVHQQGFGAVGVSRKYGKRSYARYPIFWGLKKVGNLPNPDPSDTGEWNKELPKDSEIQVDPSYEASRGELKRQAQEWAGLEQNPDADLLVFVGRWSMQKGIDLIADVMPAVLEGRPNVQLICVGPVIDLYGKFAALKLDRMMRLYPGRVFSKPEFTALPPFIFSGAEFALIPSRDEPFGLVAVEFGRKGALGIGARVGGLGQMPGWWYNIESTTTSHLLHQFKLAIESALNSKTQVRAKMRARSAKQRFPVAQWVEDLEILQSTAMRIHSKGQTKSNSQPLTPSGYTTPSGMITPNGMMTPPIASPGTMTPTGMQTPPIAHSREGSYINISANRDSAYGPQQRNTIIYSDLSPNGNEQPRSGLSRQLSLGVRAGPGHLVRRGRRRLRRSSHMSNEESGTASMTEESSDDDLFPSYYGEEEYTLTPEQVEEGRRVETAQQRNAQRPLASPTNSDIEDGITPSARPPWAQPGNRLSSASVLSVDSIVGEKKDYKLQKVDPFFTDSTGEYYRAFDQKLEKLNGSNSESQLCIEEYLIKSEKRWFDKFRDARLGRNQSPASSIFQTKVENNTPMSSISHEDMGSHESGSDPRTEKDEFRLGHDYIPPSGLKKWMQVRVRGWPVYSLFLGLGQIIAANSYQITLLAGENGQTAEKLYGIATVYCVTSIIWWFFFRFFKSVFVLSLPWFLYGLSFVIIGVAHFETNSFARGWIQNVGSGVYAAASSSGSLFFALNFGDENGVQVKDWVYRACLIQGSQQAYIIGLWYWGTTISRAVADGVTDVNGGIINSWKMTAICMPIAAFLWAIGLIVFFGLPNYYRQSPGKVPSFYQSVFRRKIVLWNFVVVILQNFFLSAPYGRNWAFLWSSNHAKAWQVGILVVVFFGAVWVAILCLFGYLSKRHSWILPVFACGLGAPRWAQIWWGVSGMGLFLPWAGSSVSGALASRSLWLWLGILDALQGLGFGMILLQTLTRVHICFTLLASQVLGSIATIVARACAPNKIGPGPISPDVTAGGSSVANAWFWIALFFQLLICAGFLLFFRKEQLTKP
ncbi:Cell wall alpha-1,3-glucan synthase ags1 [Aspergillus alliaceus]|uniref:alpha-1,3-glucan synthase n=1 Tax=Petromyces alliaceus TaxID=209559 RepID=A0A8H6AC55_PETAA|nr:Cell wall alpha-1,3-glucan synthase ags1 [Aspergillus burnettii]